ncbi:maleylpyruvate isomerase N-terminal domain-containing protein [Streptomyces sp. HU2014]|uniref:maleylpyruvate isomerase N-terminal domain-containing protein n=1 Tax=Streptomyces TaxID=1883 RepID=UPI000B446CEE|nr:MULTISPECIES: maleylpyruvate isomerase N-terminal domain-containing protein [Streptomyces]UQI49522.1 maleylpyruvate isomerase N-terminal domain-containing protein [Streptomyces sp. HU2014]
MLTEAADRCTAVLARASREEDWARPAHGLDWSCRATLDHLALGLVGYAGLLTARPTDRYIALFASLDPEAPLPARLEGIRIAAALLAATIRGADPRDRAWHPWGHSDAAGFAAMGLVETLVHTDDLARALGIGWRLPDELCAPVLARLFPDVPDAAAGHSPAATLLWATGRGALPGHDRRAEWAWDGTVR